ncbi:MAG: glycine cleavage system aminomethyltransferase GcvT ['Candidatus Kapabacteria' thiocyanatum]|uniref:aminomethyltransferase n=1 Tax=Candidatus Kapaibacterium thiocyanatum TaxID=1895771 RepID=A0A1M3L1B0_9BACT|nr:glycine cleavage system aminomethyltransferase GcvT ['Candidatus Kapabacteria' thiocyanatum]OJX58726.1 MAG: glycine cleavage system protein T ['Candidatus Kapabacteria' thiocyanatum]
MKTTVFHPIHVAAGAKMVSFAGFEMPIQYPKGILHEHNVVRTGVGVFDVSHMGEFEVRGADALAMIQKITVNDASKLAPGKAQYSAMCYGDGGIVDDLLVYHRGDHYMLVVNGANVEKDWNWIVENAAEFSDVKLTNESDNVHLLAVQGPKAIATLKKLTDADLENVAYYSFIDGTLAGVPMIISRTGYTGEPGFELYFRGDFTAARSVVDALFTAGEEYGIEWIGLGARDTLRLEKGYCLYGNDIDNTTNPIEAGLGWITKLAKGSFNGSGVITATKEAGPARKLVGFVMKSEKLIPRQNYEIVSNGDVVGKVTSGNVSPGLNTGIGLGYVRVDLAAPGTAIEIKARGTTFPAEVAKIPFL